MLHFVGESSLFALEEDLRVLNLKERQQKHSILKWQKVPESASLDQEITRLQAQILLEKATGEEVSEMLESTGNTFRCRVLKHGLPGPLAGVPEEWANL
jgi:hypothetical protein